MNPGEPLRRTVGLARTTTLSRQAFRRATRQPSARTAAARQAPSEPRGATKKPRPTGWTQDVRAAVQARSQGRCEIQSPDCLGPATNVHHRLPLRMGGSSNPAVRTAANGLNVCGHGNTSGCHRWLDHNAAEAGDAGWKLRAGSDPAAEPVIIAGRGLTWLTDDGRYVGEAAS